MINRDVTHETLVETTETTYIPLDASLKTPARSTRQERTATRRNRTVAHPESLLDPRAAAVDLLDDFQRLAAALSPRDSSTQDDLVQEMCLAALECTQPNQRSYYLWLAGWRAKDYLRWWLTPMKRNEATEPEREPAE